MRQLRHVLLVAEAGSFQAAAALAHRSQPAITKSIQAVEHQLGQLVFERGRRGELTDFGRQCMPSIRELLAHYDRTTEAMAALASGRQGSLVIASVGSLAEHWLPDVVRAFMAEHPDVAVRLYDDNSQNVQRMVLSGEVDFGLGSPVDADARLRCTTVVEDGFGFVCRHDHPLAARRSLPWSALDGQPMIGTTLHRQILDARVLALLRRQMLYAENVSTLIALLRGGVGVTVLADMSIPPWATDLRIVPLNRPRLRRRISIMQLSGRTPSPVAALVLARLMSRAGTKRSAHA